MRKSVILVVSAMVFGAASAYAACTAPLWQKIYQVSSSATESTAISQCQSQLSVVCKQMFTPQSYIDTIVNKTTFNSNKQTYIDHCSAHCNLVDCQR